MTIKNKLITGFLMISLLVGIVGFIGLYSVKKIQQINAISVATKNLLLHTKSEVENMRNYIQTDDQSLLVQLNNVQKWHDKEKNFWLEALMYGTNSEKFKSEDKYAVWLKENNNINVIFDNDIAEISEDIEKNFDDYEDNEEQIRMIHNDILRKKNQLHLEYSKENSIRNELKDIVYKTNNQTLIKYFNTLLDNGKEALFHYKDKKYFDNWLDSIMKIKAASNELDKQLTENITKLCDKYYLIANIMSDYTLKIKKAEEDKHDRLIKINKYVNNLEKTEKQINKIVVNYINESERVITEILVIITIVSFFLAVCLEMFIFRSISNPLIELKHAAIEISKGNIDTKLEIRSNDEIAEIAHSFNQMSENINILIEKEKKLAEKAAISAANEKKKGEELLAVNQQLKASEQQLKATNQQLKASEQQLKAANQQLKASEQQQKAVNQQLKSKEAALENSKIDLQIKINELEQLNTDIIRTRDELFNKNKELKETQAALIQSSKMNAVGQLAAGVAHEINNPLSGVLGHAKNIIRYAEVKNLNQQESIKLLLEWVEKIAKDAERCKTITSNLLSFSRQDKAQMRPVNINNIIYNSVQLIGAKFRASKINLDVEVDESLPMISGSESELQQVFINLLINAEQATSAGGKVLIKTSQQDDNYIQISFLDTGEGIAKENLEHIFDAFFTTKPPGKGTGLGLSICYRIIKDHKGDIKVESIVDGGSVFIIRLPVIEQLTKRE